MGEVMTVFALKNGSTINFNGDATDPMVGSGEDLVGEMLTGEFYRGYFIRYPDESTITNTVARFCVSVNPTSATICTHGTLLAAKSYIDFRVMLSDTRDAKDALGQENEERRQIARRKADVENYEAREQLRLTTNALGLAINLLEHQAELQPWQVDALKITLDMSRETLKSK